MSNKNRKKIGIVLLCGLLFLLAFTGGCGAQKTESKTYYTSLSELEHKRIGVSTGSIQAIQAQERLPEAEFFYYNTQTDMLNALRADKIDAFAEADALLKYMISDNPDLTYLDEWLAGGMESCAIFPKTEKGKALCDEFSEFIRKIKANGVYDEIQNIWFGSDEEKKVVPDLENLKGSRGTLRVAADPAMVPFVFIKDGKLAGTDIDTAVRFCKEYDYSLEVVQMDFAGILPAVSTGKCDLACGGVAYSDERAETLYFSEPTYEGGSVVAVLKDPAKTPAVGSASESVGFFASLEESFVKNFIREDRWKMILSGLGVTLALSALAAVVGTVLGGLICFLRTRKNKVARGFANVYIRIFRGIPIVVLLLVLNYLIFTGAEFPAFWVCVIGFSLDFSAYTSEMFRNGIEAVPEGQSKAAKAMGFSGSHGFRKIIFPQALLHILPVYTGQFIALVKLTSVAGYISVMDLTRAADIIRSRTFEAFFPLILTALIYFLLSVVLIALLRKLEKKIQPGTRRILKVQKLMEARTAGRLSPFVHQREVSEEEKNKHPVLYQVSHLKKEYETVTPIKDLNCEVRLGDVISIIGPSGTGKSTFLYMLNQLEPVSGGEILFKGENILEKGYDLRALRRKVGMVFQAFYLFSHLTIVENIMLAQEELLHRSKEDAFQYSMEVLEKVGLADKALNYPAELSGGQQQRVAIAREVAMDPEMILFDEPTSALDPTTIGEVLAVIRQLALHGMTMVIVTHEMKFARDVSSRVFYLDEGGVYEEGSPDQIFRAPKREKTRQFIEHLKVMKVKIEGTSFDYAGTVTEMETFGYRHMIDYDVVRRMIILTEELGIAILQKHFQEKTDAELIFEYQDETGKLQTKVIFKGGEYDPLTEGDELSIALIRNAVAELAYRREGETGIIEGEINQR